MRLFGWPLFLLALTIGLALSIALSLYFSEYFLFLLLPFIFPFVWKSTKKQPPLRTCPEGDYTTLDPEDHFCPRHGHPLKPNN